MKYLVSVAAIGNIDGALLVEAETEEAATEKAVQRANEFATWNRIHARSVRVVRVTEMTIPNPP